MTVMLTGLLQKNTNQPNKQAETNEQTQSQKNQRIIETQRLIHMFLAELLGL